MSYEEAAKAAEKFMKAREAYRNKEIGDDEYLAARAEWEQNQKDFDASRNESA